MTRIDYLPRTHKADKASEVEKGGKKRKNVETRRILDDDALVGFLSLGNICPARNYGHRLANGRWQMAKQDPNNKRP